MLTLHVDAGMQDRDGVTEDAPSVLSEGYAYNRSTDQINRFQVYSDSTIVLSTGSGETEQIIQMSVDLFELVGERVENRLYGERSSHSELGVGVEDRALHLSLIQQYDLQLIGGLTGGFVLVVGLSVWLGIRLRRSRRTEQVLRSRYQALQEGEERERRRIAREIHDGPVQTLHGLHFQMAATQLATQGDGAASPTEAKAQNSGMEDRLMDAVHELRAISEGLHPASLERFGLVAALDAHARRLIETIPSEAAPTIRVESEEESFQLADNTRLALYRIVQEALSNAVQHAEATTIEVQAQVEEDKLHMIVEDNGIGFNVEDATVNQKPSTKTPSQLGLIGLHERADMIGATVQIDSTSETGTTVHVICPYASHLHETVRP